MDAAHWPQGIGIVIRAVESTRPVEKKPRPQREEALNCARCNSTHTKFCYYNNYSLSQPRYFCKACRRYWTQGGILRNVPVGGSCRKKQRSSKKVLSENLSPPKISPQNPKIYDGHALNLTYNQPIYNGITEFVALPFALDTQNPNFSSSHSSDLPSMASNSNPVSSSTYSMHEFNPRLRFSLDGLENGSGYFQSTVQNQSTSSRIIFPFEEYASNCELGLDNKGQPVVDSNGYWNGMLPGGSPIL